MSSQPRYSQMELGLRLPGTEYSQAEHGGAPMVAQIQDKQSAYVGGDPVSPLPGFSWKTFLIVLIFGGVLAIAVVTGITYGNTAKGSNAASAEDVGLIDAKVDLITDMLNYNDGSESSDEGASAANGPSSTTLCDVVIIGTGPGGLYAGYRLAPIYGNKLCLVDERNYPGGKVLSVALPQSSPEDLLFTPTHAEQYRAGDVALRCLGQELGVPTVAFGSGITHFEGVFRGVNFTGVMCIGNNNITGAPECAWGLPEERLAANGDFPDTYPNMWNPCGESDWTECSNCDLYFTALMNNNNVKTIAPGESFADYAQRILNGASSVQYFADICGYPYPITASADAKAYIEYLNYDFGYSYNLVLLPQGGPQAMWKKVDELIRGNGSRVFQGQKVNSIARTTGGQSKLYRYTIQTTSGLSFLAKRFILAIPALAIEDLSGNIADTIKASQFVQKSGYNRACTWNGAWEDRWWNPDHTTCNFGFCTLLGVANGSFVIDADPLARNLSSWSFISDQGIPFAQWRGTPERQKANLFRIFFEDADCDPLESAFASNGQNGVTDIILARLRTIFGEEAVPEPLFGFYRYEEYSYQITRPGASFKAKDMTEWAKRPMRDEEFCIVGESFNPLDSGWQDAAITSAHNCFRGSVFDDIKPSMVTGWETCKNTFTNRMLKRGHPGTFDLCLLLSNEVHARDMAGLEYCGGPTELPVSTGEISVVSTDEEWENAEEDTRESEFTHHKRIRRHALPLA